MEEVNVRKSFTEVLEILKNIPDEEYNKISKKFLKFLEENKDKNYDFKVDINKDIKELNLLNETKIMLAIIYKDYWCSEEQRAKLNQELKENEKKYQEELKEKYNYDNLFKKDEKIQEIKINNDIDEKIDQMSLILKKESWFVKIKNYILNIFRKD